MKANGKVTTARGTLKQKLASQVRRRMASLAGKIAKYQETANEFEECRRLLATLGDDTSAPRAAGSPGGAETFGPASEEGLRVLGRLPDEFNADALKPHLNGDYAKSYQWIAAWLRQGRIESVRRGLYQRAKPSAGASAKEQAYQQFRATVPGKPDAD